MRPDGSGGRENRLEGSRRKLEQLLDASPIDRGAIVEAGVALCDTATGFGLDDVRARAYDYLGSRAAQWAFGFGRPSLEELGLKNARKAVEILDAARQLEE